jgi:glycerophosphoryl diester phosphodiesterase
MIQNIAHRGASAYEPENTLRAFELALAMEATMIEVDIHLSADGHPVVMHDAQLCRTTNGQGKIAKLRLSDLRRLDAGKGEQIPTLTEAIKCVRGRAQLYLELKDPFSTEPVIHALQSTDFVDHAIVASFLPWLPQKAKFLEPRLRTSMLVRMEDRSNDYISWALSIEADYVHPSWEKALAHPHALVPPDLIASIRNRGLGIILWHEERLEELKELVKLDVDGICTNTPDVLATILKTKPCNKDLNEYGNRL